MPEEPPNAVELEHHADAKAVGTESQPTFWPFNADRPLRVYYRHLPHWRQSGATYFVTFRQADSIPKAVLAEWLDVRQRWYRAQGLDSEWLKTDTDRFATAYAKILPGVRQAFERQQARFLHDELDRAHGSCVLRHAAPQQELIESLSHFHAARFWLGDFVVMPNHVHALIQPFDGLELEDLLGSIKKWTSRRIGHWLTAHPDTIPPDEPQYERDRFWQQESYDRIVRDVEELSWFRKYIADNAAQAQVPAGEFHYSAAKWLDQFAPRPT